MSNPDQLISVLTIVAVFLIILIFTLIGVWFFIVAKQKKNDGEKSEVDATTLSSDDYKLMKPLSKLKKNVSCTGKVVVQKVNNKYIYTPYLDCCNSYKTEELYKSIKNKNKVVTSGNGLYEMNGEYVFRGDTVNYYVKLSKWLIRIVKITSDNKILLIPEYKDYYSDVWDDRYNSD